VPVSSMPHWLQEFANHQPVTFVIDTMRALALGGPLEPRLWQAVVSIVGVFVVFGPLAVAVYKRSD
jgi:ABC-2 type transport system permease protein/oleandomycin transport system permease protein